MSAARPQSDSSTVSRVLAGTTLALKVAREATDSVSIAKQILGSAAHISEFAEKIEKNRKAMNDLIAKSAEYARHIDTMVAGRVVEGKVLSNLRRLYSVFTRIEALVAEAAAVKNGVKRRLHNIFIAPNNASGLSSELEKEMQLFHLAMMLDVRLAISETAEETLRAIHGNDLYDSDGFRHLRPADVRKLDNLPTDRWQEDNNVAFATAHVNGELMVIRHSRSRSLPSAWAMHLDVLKELSYPRTQHANIVQLYGQSVGDPENAFVAFRSGCHKFRDYAKHNKVKMSPQLKAVKAFEMAIKLLDASRHIECVLGSIWVCQDIGFFAVDDECNPTIGLFDYFKRKPALCSSSFWNIDWALRFWFTTYTSQFSRVQDLQVVCAILRESNVPREIVKILICLQGAELRANRSSQSIPIDYPPPSWALAPTTVGHARNNLQLLSQSPFDIDLEHFQPKALVLSSQQPESIWTFQYSHARDSLQFSRCWIENGSRRYERVTFCLDGRHALAVKCRVILGEQYGSPAEYHSEHGWCATNGPLY